MSGKASERKTGKPSKPPKKTVELTDKDLDRAKGGGPTVLLRRLANPHLAADQGGSR